MASTKKTTYKPISLGYRPVGSLDTVEYTACMGVLRGMTIAQDSPDETEIKSQFSPAPFAMIDEFKPLTMSFELVNYTLEEIKALFGGTYTAASSSAAETYVAPTDPAPVEKEWKVAFQRGNTALVILRGSTVATTKMDDNGALSYVVKITSLLADSGYWKVIGDPKTA